jgi:hypothetical protein
MLKLTSSHFYTHWRNRIERGRKKREREGEGESDCDGSDTVLNCTTSIADFVHLFNIFIYALEKAVQADAYSLQNANRIEYK